MRIAMISEHASPLAALGGVDAGGQNVHVAELATGLVGLGHDVVVHTRRDDPRLPAAVRTDAGFTVEHVPAGPPEPLPKDELLPHMGDFGEHLADTWADEPPDLVHAHFWMSGLAALRGARALEVPVLQTFHALGVVKRRHQGDKDTSPPQRVRLEADLATSVDMVIATCSDEVRELAELGLPPARTAVVPCGIDVDAFFPAGGEDASRPPRILCIGRMVERKGIDTVILALAEIPDAELLVAGGPGPDEWNTDPEVARLAGIARRFGVADRVRFLGRIDHDQVPELYRSVDVVVSAPWYEPFGIVPLEAMACGVPPVVTAVGGHLDTVIDRATGLHVPPRDPRAVARAIRELLAHPDWRAELGESGAELVRGRYGWNRLARETAAVYEQARARRATPVTATRGVAS
ncbi:glycosyltransferase [Saccharopolyspora sp. 5N102]|uniref:glycosyltransferase n=1 Tax=Saccharopolyspora sp. 5N102 TaxID=3375155 RepID=UPI00378BF3AB